MESRFGILVSDSDLDLSPYGIESLSPDQFLKTNFSSPPAVIGIYFQDSNSDALAEKTMELIGKSEIQLIGISSNLKLGKLKELVTQLHPFRWSKPEKDELVRFFQEAFAKYFSHSQERDLSLLLEQKNIELKKLGVHLENLVQQRQTELEESTKKYEKVENNLQLLQKVLTYIYAAKTIPEIEHSIVSVLKKEISIDQVKIRLRQQSNWKFDSNQIQTFSIPITFGTKDIGELVLTHDGQTKNTGENRKFFRQIAEAVGLAIENSVRKQQEQNLGMQWKGTFDAISYPISLTDSNFNILQTNKAYKNYCEDTGVEASHAKCYEIFFEKDQPCAGCRTMDSFKVSKNDLNKSIFDVRSSRLASHSGLQYMHSYKDITQSLNLERQKIESAKMVELGTISSSIAHELNNPIGGMLNFIQLIQMDLEGSEPYFQDIASLEDGTRKCKNIVQNLLGFTRKAGGSQSETLNFLDIIEQACKIVELKTRSSGIAIHKDFPLKPVYVNGRFNLLSQAILCLLQNSQESLINRRLNNPGFRGEITLKISLTEDQVQLHLSDNGKGISSKDIDQIFNPLFTTKDPLKNSGLGLTLARQIFEEHGGYVRLKESQLNRTVFELELDRSEVES